MILEASIPLIAGHRQRKRLPRLFQFLIFGPVYENVHFCFPIFLQLCVLTVSDIKAAPSSETQRAQASVSDASLIRVEALFSASPPWTASLPVRSALAVWPWHGVLNLNWHMQLYIFFSFILGMSSSKEVSFSIISASNLLHLSNPRPC